MNRMGDWERDRRQLESDRMCSQWILVEKHPGEDVRSNAHTLRARASNWPSSRIGFHWNFAALD